MSTKHFIKVINKRLTLEQVWIPFRRGSLEGWLSYDEGWTLCDGVILLPPHPHFAGSMDNNVIKSLAIFLSEAGFLTLRFNYPGVGASSIDLPKGISSLEYWNTVEEKQLFEEAIQPTLVVLTHLNQSLESKLKSIHLLGYSFGAMVALRVAERVSSISSVTAISLPWISRYQYDFLKNVFCPKLFINGKRDFTFVPTVYNEAWQWVTEPKKMKSLDSDHFFRKQEEELGKEVLSFLLNL